MRLGVIGLNKANLDELLGAKDRAQDRWVEVRRDLNPLAHIVDADAALLAADFSCNSSAARQEGCITLLKQVELGVADYLADVGCH